MGVREALRIVESFPRDKGRIFNKTTKPLPQTEYEKEWKAYSCFPKTIAPNDGQVCVGSLVVVGVEAMVMKRLREQVYTSPFLQVSPLVQAYASTGAAASSSGGGARFDIRVTKAGASRLSLINAVRDFTGLSLNEAKALVDSDQFFLLSDVTSFDAQGFKKIMEAAGATVQLIDH